MKRHSLTVSALASTLLLGLTSAVAVAADNITIKNASDWHIVNFYLSSSADPNWGPDQLGEQVIGSGQNFELRGVPCDTYDVRIVDQDEDVCIVRGIELCGANGWTITSQALLNCQVDTATKGEGE